MTVFSVTSDSSDTSASIQSSKPSLPESHDNGVIKQSPLQKRRSSVESSNDSSSEYSSSTVKNSSSSSESEERNTILPDGGSQQKVIGDNSSKASSELSDVIEDDGTGNSDIVIVKKEDPDNSSNTTVAESLGLLHSILSDQDAGEKRPPPSDSSDKEISEEILIPSDPTNKSSSTTDNEELLKQFRQQQANRRYRPRSAKIRHKIEPETQDVVKVFSHSDSDSERETAKQNNEGRRRNRPKFRSERKVKSESSSKSSSGTLTPVEKPVFKQDRNSDRYSSYSEHSSHLSSSEESSSSSENIQKKPADKSAIKEEQLQKEKSSSNTDSDSLLNRPKQKNTLKPHHRDDKQARIEELVKSIQQIKEKPPIHSNSSVYSSSTNSQFDFQKNRRDQISSQSSQQSDNQSIVSENAISLRELLEQHQDEVRNHYLHKYLESHLEKEVQRHGQYFSRYERTPPKTPHSPNVANNRKSYPITNNPFSWIYMSGRLIKVFDDMGQNIQRENGTSNNRISPRPRDKSSQTLERKITPRLGIGGSNSRKNSGSLKGKNSSRSRSADSRLSKSSRERSRSTSTSKNRSIVVNRRRSFENRSSRSDSSGKWKKKSTSRDRSLNSSKERDKSGIKDKIVNKVTSITGSPKKDRKGRSTKRKTFEKKSFGNNPKNRSFSASSRSSSRSRSASRSKSSGRSSTKGNTYSSHPERPKTAFGRRIPQILTRNKSRSSSRSSRDRKIKRSSSRSSSKSSRDRSKGRKRSRSAEKRNRDNKRSRSRSSSKSSKDRTSKRSRSRSLEKKKEGKKKKRNTSHSSDRSSRERSKSKEKRKTSPRQKIYEATSSSSDDEYSTDGLHSGDSHRRKKEKWYKKLAKFTHWEQQKNEKRRLKNEQRMQEEEMRREQQNSRRGILSRRQRKWPKKTVRIAFEEDGSYIVPTDKFVRKYPDTAPIYSLDNPGGYLLPYQYMTTLTTEDDRRKGKKGETMPTRIILVPAPVHLPNSRTQRYNRRISTLNKRKSRNDQRVKRRKQKSRSIFKKNKEQDAKSEDSLTEMPKKGSNSSDHSGDEEKVQRYPQVRPGSGRIKCSWKNAPNKSEPQFKGVDHQLKDTDNPVLLEWLKRKNENERRQKREDYHKRRYKTEMLIDEQNFRDEKREKAMEEFQRWKKRKDREILLRRRAETLEANSILYQKKYSEGTAATFSALRSSSTQNVEKSSPKPKPRPKSASYLRVSFLQDENSQMRPRSASPRTTSSKKNDQKVKHVPSNKPNFMKSCLKMDNASEADGKAVSSESRHNYEKWVRSTSGTKDPKKRKNKKNKQVEHNPLDNELISDLAKRRIKSILDNKKRVDTGINRPRTAPAKIKSDGEKDKQQTIGKNRWRLRTDDIIPSNKPSNIQSKNTTVLKSERPKFSYIKKTSNKAGNKYERNPVLRRTVYENAAPA